MRTLLDIEVQSLEEDMHVSVANPIADLVDYSHLKGLYNSNDR